MSYSANRFGLNPVEDRSRPEPRQWRPAKWMVFAYLIGLAVLCAVTLLNKESYDGAKIAAGEFRWPAGCEERRYRPGDQLPQACFDRFQKISPKWARLHHLKIRQGRKSSWYSYYRLGDDAVEKICIMWEGSCRVGNVYQSLFVTDPRISDPTSSGWRTVEWTS